jgi:antitoxin HicB
MKRKHQSYLKQPYRMTLAFDEESNAWVVRYPELPGCLAHGATPKQALKEGEEAKALWIESAIENGIAIPPPQQTTAHSGKLILRLPRTLHEAAAESAQREGASLNSYSVQLVSEGVQRSGMKELLARLKDAHRPSQASRARTKQPHKPGIRIGRG